MTRAMNTKATTSDVLTFIRPTLSSVDWLRERLEISAATEGILDIAYTTIDTPIGAVLLAATTKGLLRVVFAIEGFDSVLESLGHKISPRILKAPKRLDAAASALDGYFAGRRTTFELPLDHSLSHGFRLLVHQQLTEIGYGKTKSYQEVAALVGSPKASRAVGTACATNPLPIVVPCHRVLRSNGDLGGYAGGLATKEALLRLEGARP